MDGNQGRRGFMGILGVASTIAACCCGGVAKAVGQQNGGGIGSETLTPNRSSVSTCSRLDISVDEVNEVANSEPFHLAPTPGIEGGAAGALCAVPQVTIASRISVSS